MVVIEFNQNRDKVEDRIDDMHCWPPSNSKLTGKVAPTKISTMTSTMPSTATGKVTGKATGKVLLPEINFVIRTQNC